MNPEGTNPDYTSEFFDKDYNAYEIESFQERHQFYNHAEDMAILFNEAIKLFFDIKDEIIKTPEEEYRYDGSRPSLKDANDKARAKQNDADVQLPRIITKLQLETQTMFVYCNHLRDDILNGSFHVVPVPGIGIYECIKANVMMAEENQPKDAHVKLVYDQPVMDNGFDRDNINEQVTIELYDKVLNEQPMSLNRLTRKMNLMTDKKFYPYRAQMYFNKVFEMLNVTKKLYESAIACLSMLVIGTAKTKREKLLFYEIFLWFETNLREFKVKVMNSEKILFYVRKVLKELNKYRIKLEQKNKVKMSQKQEWWFVFNILYKEPSLQYLFSPLPHSAMIKEYDLELERSPDERFTRRERRELENYFNMRAMEREESEANQEQVPEYILPDEDDPYWLEQVRRGAQTFYDAEGNEVQMQEGYFPTDAELAEAREIYRRQRAQNPQQPRSPYAIYDDDESNIRRLIKKSLRIT